MHLGVFYLLPEICLHHHRVLLDLIGRALGDFLAVVKHRDPFANLHHHPQDMLNDDHR